MAGFCMTWRTFGKAVALALIGAHVHETDRHFHQSDHLRFNHSRHFARATAGPPPWGGARRWRLTEAHFWGVSPRGEAGWSMAVAGGGGATPGGVSGGAPLGLPPE